MQHEDDHCCEVLRTPSLGGEVDEKNLSSRAPSVHFLKCEFCADVEAGGFAPDCSVYEIEADIIRARGSDVLCPRDGRLGAAYVDTLSSDKNVGPATHFLSYAWGNSVQDIVDSLTTWQDRRNLDPRRTNVWLCCLCENLHRPRRREAIINPQEFANIAMARILGIGKVLALVGPWFAPLFVGRCWCLYELHISIQLLGDGGLEILMPPREEEAFGRALHSGQSLNRILDALDVVKLENASVSSPEDRRCILSIVGERQEQVNVNIVRRLQNGFKAIAKKYLASGADDGGLATPMVPEVEEEEPNESCHSWAVSQEDCSRRSNGDTRESPQKATQDHDLVPIAEADRRWAEHCGTVDLTNVLDDVPLRMPSEQDDDGMELGAFCASKQLVLQVCAIQKCTAPAPWNNQASRPTLSHPERRLAKNNQGPCNDSTLCNDGFHL